jgi:DNA-binding GntR family transcriptional regulator
VTPFPRHPAAPDDRGASQGGSPADVPWKYIQLADGIRSQIRAGRRQARDLVSITYLTQEHDVARQTAAKALTLLESEGLVKRYPGIGYIVTQDAKGQRPS